MTDTDLPRLLTDGTSIEAYFHALRDAPVVALDTEFMRVNTYAPVLCLIQVFDGREAVCVDALDLASLDALMSALTRNGQPALLHSARQDLEAFVVTDGTLPDALYDTQIGAALTGPDDQLSYAQLVLDVTGTELPKSQTRTNWAKRPLTDKQLQYAADDVLYLPAIRDELDERLDRLGRRDWFQEDCARLLDPALYAPDIEHAWRRLKSRRPLDDAQRGALRALCALREQLAVKRNRPRKWILDDGAVETLATLDSPTADSVRKTLKRTRAHRAVRADEVLRTLDEAKPVADDRPGRPSAAEVQLQKRIMAVLRTIAGDLNVAPSVLGARRDVERLVRGRRDGPLLTGWRRDVVGVPLLAAIDAAA